MQADPLGHDLDPGGLALIPPWLRPLWRSPAGVLKQNQPQAGRLFIIGAARSGTTVLQNALNDCPDIFLLGEPELLHDTDPGFAVRYNGRHRGWGNQEMKSTFCPSILNHDGTWREYFDSLGERFKWVGAKMVVNPVRPAEEMHEMFDFYCRHFYDAHYIFAFRDPLATVMSTRDLQLLSQGQTDGVPAIMRNVADVVALYVRMLRNLPNVRALFHEEVDAGSFKSLGSWLDVALNGAAAYYDARRVRSYDVAQLTIGERETMEVLRALYSDLRQGAACGFSTPQLEQNDGHLSSSHYTLLGSIDRRARMISDALSV